MFLKKTTTFQDGTTDTDYIPLKSDFTITTPDSTGSFKERKFGYNDEIPENDVITVISWKNEENKPIFIFKDQEASIIGNDGNTILVIHKQLPIKVWCREKATTDWFPCSQMDYNLYRYDSNYEFKQCFPEEDPNQTTPWSLK